jgi:hypothetical protein
VTINDLHDLVRLLREHPEWQAELRRLILTDELLELPSLVRQLVEAQRRTEEQVAQLTEAQRRTEEASGAVDGGATPYRRASGAVDGSTAPY